MNNSGYHPKGERIVIKPETVERTSAGGIILVDKSVEQHANAQVFGVLVEAGPDAWTDYKEPFAQVGERVMFAKYGGLQVTGKDGEAYRVCNDTDITCGIDPEVEFELSGRKPFGAAA